MPATRRPALGVQAVSTSRCTWAAWRCATTRSRATGAYVLAGHLHPCVVLGGRAHQRLRLPCFHFGAQVGVLPAFGAFTGMHALRPVPASGSTWSAAMRARRCRGPQTLHWRDESNALESLIARAESAARAPGSRAAAGRWARPTGAPRWPSATASAAPAGRIEPVRHVATIRLAELVEVEPQKQRLLRNTEQFVAGHGANNVLLTGARGTGKSSLIKACLNEFAPQGLRLIEVDKADLVDLPDIVDLVAERPERFIVYCDDLSFDEGEPGYKALKSILDGSVSQASDNVLIYATSNRRHLLPEYMSENLSYKHTEDGEVHPGEVVEEKISLSERFGLWVSFYPFTQAEYLAIVAQWLRFFGVDEAAIAAARQESLVWALERGSRSGRVAYQFAKDYSGRHHA